MSLDIKTENTGLIFVNQFKEDNKKAPDYKGSIDVNGELFDIALWIKDGGKNDDFYAVAIQPPYEAEEKPQRSSKSDNRSSGKKLIPRSKPQR